jgi:putative intracellular protease/amidase
MFKYLVLLLLTTPLWATDAPPADQPKTKSHEQAMQELPPSWRGKEQIALLAYPGMTALDMMGPQYMFASLWGATVHIVAKTKDPVMSDTKVAIVPTCDFSTCPTELDVLCIPGGCQGTLAAINDPATIAFVKDRESRAKLVTSVCTGSLVLGAAGLLDGKRATSHWVVRDLLNLFGATPVDERVVVDGNVITGAGVTAGIDLGLIVVERLRDKEYARSVQLLAEYDPQPPFDAGTPAKAGEQTTQLMAMMFVELREQFKEAAAKRVK